MPNPIVHFEVGCKDRAKTSRFYRTLFDWNVDEQGFASTVDTGSGIGGHITALGHEPEHYTLFYVEVADIAAALKKAESLGGKTVVPPVRIPTGTFA